MRKTKLKFGKSAAKDDVSNPIILEIFVHPCTHSTCQKGSECHVKNNGIAVCINTECADSPSVANSTSLSQERTVGITVDIICDAGLLLNGNPHRTCHGNGQWTANTMCFECTGINHYTTYNRAQDHCESTGRTLLQLENILTLLPQLLSFTKARCVTCPGDLVADQLIRYVEDDCLTNTSYTNWSSCTCYFTTAVPGKKIRMQAVFLDLEEDMDYLWIFDGRDATFPILGSYTGDTTFTLVTNGSEAFISFTTDDFVTGAGFRLSYSMVQSDIPSSMPTSLSTPDEYFYVWMDGYVDVTSKEFITPNGTVFDLSEWSLQETHTRMCYDPVFDYADAFSDTDYCHTYCESP
ncbi:uncharacterized protein LOC110446348 [Mizuhopecten yessoensis]|uniref:uncharacterized protein LOC110446348 n=1 Tax=Mizuhopecten yessoensis TaxID=6573 RepID=UPI000B457691|nr:uncharacterized protein LOC110446348 [Mizuhopecten yessoensis]